MVNWLRRISPLSLSLLLSLWSGPSWAQDSALIDQVWHLVSQEFSGPTFSSHRWESQRQQLLARSYTDPDQIYGAIQRSLRSLGDPYTRLIDPRLSQPQDAFVGVGLHLGIDRQTGYVVTIAPIENSPAFGAGLMPGDLITAIDGVDTRGMELDEAIARICGQKGTTVTLSLLQAGTSSRVSMQRDSVTLDPVGYQVIQQGNRSLGYIRVSHFGEGVPQQMQQAIQGLESQGVQAYVLDLRGNPGGLVESSVAVAQMWLDRGTIVTLKDREGQAQRIMANESVLTDKPLAVLVDQGTASASEILAAALRDHDRAILVGTSTFGKGSVQSIHALEGGAGLAITTARYHTPRGFQIDQQGIEPDIQIELTADQRRALALQRQQLAIAGDPHFTAAIEALRSVPMMPQVP